MRMDAILASLQPVVEYYNCSQNFQDVAGYLYDVEGFTLCKLAEHGPGIGEIVEIGSFMGRSTCWLAQGSQNAARENVHAVDHFKGSPEHQAGSTHEEPVLVAEGTTLNTFKNNIARKGFAGRVVIHPEGSPQAAEGWTLPIRLLFIDAEHSYEASKLDFDTWEPHVIPHGLIAFHDIGSWEGVTTFYNELMATRGHLFDQVLASVGLRVIQKLPVPAT
jgi:predicted O-methyltransferase YrrM